MRILVLNGGSSSFKCWISRRQDRRCGCMVIHAEEDWEIARECYRWKQGQT